jgi:MYXO-CTERM domain-containing protein
MFNRKTISLLAVLWAARTAHANDWTGMGSDPQRSGRSSEQSDPSFTSAWSYSLGAGQIISAPVTSGGRVVSASSNGTVVGLDATTGKMVWSRSLDRGVRATPAIANDQVAVPTMGGALYSLSLDDGAIIWQRAFGGQNYSSPLVVRGASADDVDTLVVGAGFPQQDVWRFNARTGEPLWRTAKNAIAGIVDSSPALAGKRVVIGMNGGRYQSLDLLTGALDWKLDAGGDVYLSSPLVVGDHLYGFPGDDGARLFAVDLNSGAQVQGFPVSIPDPSPVMGGQTLGRGPAVSSPMTVAGLIIVQLRRNDLMPSKLASPPVSMREYVVAIDPILGQVRWQYLVASRVADNVNGVPELQLCATPAGFDNNSGSFVAISSSITGRVAVLEASTGKERWSSALSSPGRSSPVFSNGQLLVATDDGVLHAFSSTSNRAPTAPSEIGPASGEVALTADGALLDWAAATDPEGGLLSYVVRVKDAATAGGTPVETATAPGQNEIKLMLTANTAYDVSVRSRDAQGALSPWSPARHIRVTDAPPPSPARSAGSTFVTVVTDMMVPLPGNATVQKSQETAPSSTPEAAPATPAPQQPACAPATKAGDGTPMAVPGSTGAAAVEPAPAGAAVVELAPAGAAAMEPAPAGAAYIEPAPASAGQAASTLANAAPTAGPSPTDQRVVADPGAREPGLAERCGCSVSGGQGTTFGSLLVVGLLAFAARRRVRPAARRLG